MKLIPSISKALALLLIGAGMLSSFGAYAQNTVKGTVSDATGPLPGVTVVQAGTTNGTVTDVDGNFSINVPEGAVLQVSFVGYKTEEITVGKQAVYNVVLSDDTTMLDEVVVTGYGGTQRRAKVTNSIAKVDEQTFQIGTHASPATALSGAVSGLRVVQNSGNPNSLPTITLRGGTNLDGTGTPLVIVDGQLRDSMMDINPEDIESMDVLKDAGATAIYGARASNGVILITTKKGKEGHAEIDFKAKVGINYAYLPYNFLDAEGYIYWLRTAYNNLQGTAYSNYVANLQSNSQAYGIGRTELDNSTVWNIMTMTDENKYLLNKGWRQMKDPITGKDIIFKSTNPADYNLNNPSITQDYNASVSGGNDKGTYYAGIGYNNSQGLPQTTYYKRLSFVFNGSYKINKWLTSSSSLNFIRSNWRSMTATNGDNSSYFGRIMSTPPTVRFEDEDGNMLLGNSTGDGNQNFQNDKFLRDFQNDKFTMIQSFKAQITNHLTFNITGNWYYNEDLQEQFNKDYATNQAGTSINKGRNTSAAFQRYFTQTYNATLQYVNTFADAHNLDAMVGAEYFDRALKAFSASGQGAPTDDFQDLSLTSAKENMRSISSSHEQYRIMSFFGRVNYDYLNKYLFSFTFREDGYSALLNNRWGFFPGVSAGWVFSNEDFVKNAIPAMSFGKLRVSYGQNGNASGIGAYDLQGNYGSVSYNGSNGFLIGSLPNPSLRWEKTTTFEVGADVSFFHNRLNANITYYNRLTDDKYAALSLPSTTGFSSITSNNGQIRNQGVELDLSAKLIQKGDFYWDVKGNIAYNKNIIVKLPENGLKRNRQGGVELYTGNGNETAWFGGYQEGQEPGMIYGYKAVKMFRSWDEIPGDYEVRSGHWNGYYQLGPAKYAALTDAQKATAYGVQPGDMQWEDINKDGIIDAKDQVVIGNTTPHWTGGFNTTFRWKDLTFYGRFDYALGFYTMDSNANSWRWFMGCMQGAYNAPTDVWDTYTAENPNAKYPRYTFADQFFGCNYYRDSDLWATRGDYLAIRELSLAYRLPKKWADAISCHKLEFSVTGQNLGYLRSAKAKTSNPESTGTSAAAYNLPRTLILGINFVF